MKTALKWIGWGLLALVALVVFDDLDKTTVRWAMAGGAAGWFGYVVLDKLERIRVDIARLQGDLYAIKSDSKFSEEVLLDLKRKIG